MIIFKDVHTIATTHVVCPEAHLLYIVYNIALLCILGNRGGLTEKFPFPRHLIPLLICWPSGWLQLHMHPHTCTVSQLQLKKNKNESSEVQNTLRPKRSATCHV